MDTPYIIGRFHEIAQRDKGTMAQLRSSCGDELKEAVVIGQIFGSQLPSDFRSWRFRCICTAASLFAITRAGESGDISRGQGNMGNLFLLVKENPSRDRRFARLLESDESVFLPRLRQTIRYLHSAADARINWFQLLNDMFYWRNADRQVQLAWASSFYRNAKVKRNND